MGGINGQWMVVNGQPRPSLKRRGEPRNSRIEFPRCSGPKSPLAVWRGNGDPENAAPYFSPDPIAFPFPLKAGTVN